MRLLHGFMTLPSALICALASCSSAAAAPGTGGSASIDPAAPDGTATSATSAASAYFSIRADLRKCAYPMCGGWFLSRLNSSTTQCHDGSTATSCYTPVLDWTNSGLDDTQQAALSEAANHAARSPGVYAIVLGQFARTSMIFCHSASSATSTHSSSGFRARGCFRFASSTILMFPMSTTEYYDLLFHFAITILSK